MKPICKTNGNDIKNKMYNYNKKLLLYNKLNCNNI